MKQTGEQKDDDWHKAMAKLFPFWGMEHRDKNKAEQIPPPNVLMEVVSARGLNSIKGVDACCHVRVGRNEVHRTKTIWNDPDPIWTILTGSLCLLRIAETDEETETDDPELHSVVVEVKHGNECIGIVAIPFKEVFKKMGEREEFPIRPKLGSKTTVRSEEDLGTLALRFRKASDEDLKILIPRDKGDAKKTESISIKPNVTNLKLLTQRKGVDGKHQFKTQPFADPDRLEETTWLTNDQIQDETIKPSTNWVEAGYGTLGRLFVEIIGCDKLMNMDLGINDTTDSFAAIVFEDSLVRTDVINDCLNPRWMPWSRRAFAFNIFHPSSLLFMGVFDYDELGNHDPIGRIGISTSTFHGNTTYLLTYRLRHRESNDDERGSITIRLRIEWKSESHAIKKTFTLPPRFFINVPSEKSLELVRYICRGSVNMSIASLESVKQLATELLAYGSVACYLLDVIVSLWLWRGQARLSIMGKQIKFWFPIHSAVVFVAAVLAIEVPLKIPAILSFLVAWVLLTLGYHNSRHPDPWRRCKTAGELTLVGCFGRRIGSPININAGVDTAAVEALEKLDKVKAERVAGFLCDFGKVALKIRRIYQKSNVINIDISTEDSSTWSILRNNLHHVHLGLYFTVTHLNMFRNFVNWRGYGAYFTSMELLALGVFFLFFPIHLVIVWMARIFVWTTLGPLMKVVDICFLRRHIRTRDELEADPAFHGTNVESMFASTAWVDSLMERGRIASEEAMKLKAMRQHRFGVLSHRVPAADVQRLPSVPLETSTAHPYLGSQGDPGMGYVDVEADKMTWSFVNGQHLTGTMLHHHQTIVGNENDRPREEVTLI